jgi:HD superfamily phosphohydrolase
MDRDQRIRDPIHNLIKFSVSNPDDKILWTLIQSEPMQRLRRIKQLGFSDFVYPGASHTRLSHSIGAMQMARRMWDILERNNVFKKEARGYKKWRRATLCAALLHDIGHGPFSHVFEDVSEKLGIEIRHETYTKKIIQKKEIADILIRGDVLQKVLSLFKEEAGATPYSTIISSQFDADRLDFLIRDRYFTGLRSVAIDLEWLLDSLRIEKVPLDLRSAAKGFTLVFGQKGVSAVEEYFSAYAKMYSNVYFHKTTRAVQFMVQDILLGIFSSSRNQSMLPANDPLLAYFREAPNPSLTAYLKLDDASVLNCIRYVAKGGFGRSTTLSRRFLTRDLYKPYPVPQGDQNDPPTEALSKFMHVLKKKKLFHHLDLAPAKGYKQYQVSDGAFLKNVLVRRESDKEIKSISRFSPAIDFLVARPPVCFYFRNEKDRQKARRLWPH